MSEKTMRKLRRGFGGVNAAQSGLYMPTGATIGEALQNQLAERREYLAAELVKIGAEMTEHGQWAAMAQSAADAAMVIYPDLEEESAESVVS